MWTPSEIIVHQQVNNDPATLYFLSQCPGVPVTYAKSRKSEDIVAASHVADSSDLKTYMEPMIPMFEPKVFERKKTKKAITGEEKKTRPSIGKCSFTEAERIAIFGFVRDEIRKYDPEIPIALCKESRFVWDQLGLDVSRCRCVCQLDFADMS